MCSRFHLSLGSSLDNPHQYQLFALSDSKAESKWTRFPSNGVRYTDHAAPRLIGLFDIKRGVATGANAFFIVDNTKRHTHQLPAELLVPILASPRLLETDEIDADKECHCLYLIDCNLPDEAVEARCTARWDYFQHRRRQGIHERYLCQQRMPWYSQDKMCSISIPMYLHGAYVHKTADKSISSLLQVRRSKFEL